MRLAMHGFKMENVSHSDRTDEQVILSMFHGMWQNRCLGVLVGLNIPEILCNAKDTISIEDVAKQAGCSSTEQLYPIMRVLAQWGIGNELPNKHFSKNHAMELLRKDRGPSLGFMFAYFCSDEYWAALLALPHTVKTGQPAFQLEHGMTHLHYMNGLHTHPYDPIKMRPGCSEHAIGSNERREEYLEIYNHAMTQLTNLQLHHKSFESKSIYDVFPWTSCTRLMDIGGSTGSFLASVLKQPGCEHIQGILVELPAVIEKARREIPEFGMPEDRIKLVSHNCFEPFPEQPEVDTIMSKNLLEMFSLEQCVTLLKNCRSLFPAKGGRFLVIVPYIPEAGDTKHLIGGNGLQPGFADIHHCSNGGADRSKSEWVDFVEKIACEAEYKVTRAYDIAFGGPIMFELEVMHS